MSLKGQAEYDVKHFKIIKKNDGALKNSNKAEKVKNRKSESEKK